MDFNKINNNDRNDNKYKKFETVSTTLNLSKKAGAIGIIFGCIYGITRAILDIYSKDDKKGNKNSYEKRNH